jgi:hypothetical protein
MTYQDALHKLGNRVSRVIDNNTTLHKCSDGAIAVRLYQTDVVTFWPDGEIKLDSGGYRTVATKERINEYAPAACHITQCNGRWYLGNVGTNGGQHFYDGLIYHPENNGFNFNLKWNPPVPGEDALFYQSHGEEPIADTIARLQKPLRKRRAVAA